MAFFIIVSPFLMWLTEKIVPRLIVWKKIGAGSTKIEKVGAKNQTLLRYRFEGFYHGRPTELFLEFLDCGANVFQLIGLVH